MMEVCTVYYQRKTIVCLSDISFTSFQVCCLFGSGGPVELYQISMNEEAPFFSDPFAGVDRFVESFVIRGSGDFSASTSGIFSFVLTLLLGTAFIL